MTAGGVYAEQVTARGLGGSHALIVDEVAPGSRVLDVGCASGYLAAELTARGCTVVGVERDPRAAALAEAHCDRVIVADLESDADLAALPRGFDHVVVGDVLEHLTDPWRVLRALREVVAPDGVVVLSIPNVAAWPVRLGLLAGSFEYADIGLLDRTHLRFFTRRSAEALATGAGFAIERTRFVHLERAPGPVRRRLPLATSVADRALARLWPGLFAQQFVLRLRPVA